MKKVIIVGGGFAGINTAKGLGNKKNVAVTLIDRRNHHLFQPLLYQVAMAGLSPADIAVPIRSILSKYKNIEVLQGEVQDIDLDERIVYTNFCELEYDFLVLACGATLSYFGHDEWEESAPGLKSISQATEIRRRVLTAFEEAEKTDDPEVKKEWLTFIVVGGGPTGVELAGAIGEMSRYTLAKDFRNIDPSLTRVMLVEMGPRILPSFDEDLASRATRDLEALGVQVWVSSQVADIDKNTIKIGEEEIKAFTTLWAAGVKPSPLNKKIGLNTDKSGRAYVQRDLSVPDYPEVFVAGDQANCPGKEGEPLPGLAAVAMQQGEFMAKNILREIAGKPKEDFEYNDKGLMATIGRYKAIVQTKRFKMTGFLAWIMWLIVHIHYLIGFRNKLFVLLQWAWSYIAFRKGARLIVTKEWRSSVNVKEEELGILHD